MEKLDAMGPVPEKVTADDLILAYVEELAKGYEAMARDGEITGVEAACASAAAARNLCIQHGIRFSASAACRRFPVPKGTAGATPAAAHIPGRVSLDDLAEAYIGSYSARLTDLAISGEVSWAECSDRTAELADELRGRYGLYEPQQGGLADLGDRDRSELSGPEIG